MLSSTWSLTGQLSPTYHSRRADDQMRYRLPADFLGYHLPPLDPFLSVLDHTRLFIALHAHVLVSHTTPFAHSDGSYLTPPRSLTTGSASHKTVTQDVSRILWYYYNDSVRPFSIHHHAITEHSANPVHILFRKRSILCLPLPSSILGNSNRPSSPITRFLPLVRPSQRLSQCFRIYRIRTSTCYLASGRGCIDVPNHGRKADYQCRPILES